MKYILSYSCSSSQIICFKNLEIHTSVIYAKHQYQISHYCYVIQVGNTLVSLVGRELKTVSGILYSLAPLTVYMCQTYIIST